MTFFRDWLLKTTHAPASAAARLHRDVVADEERLRHEIPLRSLQDLRQYRHTQPWMTRITRDDVSAVWKDYLSHAQEVEEKEEYSGEQESKPQ